MREYRPNLRDMGISEWAYKELQAFCYQYPEKKAEAAMLLGIQGRSRVQVAKDERGHEIGVVMPVSVHISSPTADAAIKRIRLLDDCDLINRVARSVGDGRWEMALILHCCYRMPCDTIDQTIKPTSNRNAFFKAKREFFCLLYQARKEKMDK